LTQARPDKKVEKTHKNTPTCQKHGKASKPWCILRVHSAKRVLNSLSVDAGAATPETHKKTPIGQKNSEAYLHIKSMVHPEGALCKKGATLTPC
jgi:hypothetical protein